MRFALLILTIFLFWGNGVLAQEFLNRDSLWLILKNTKPDSNKVKLYIQLGQQYETNNPDSALILYENALKLSNDIDYTRGIISYYTNATYVYNLLGKYDTALSLNLRSVEIAKAFGNPERLAACLGNVAASYSNLEQPEKAIEIYLQILPLYEKLRNSSNLGIVHDNLSVLYTAIKQYEKAKKNAKQAVDVFRKVGNDYSLVSALNNLAIAQMSLQEFDDAEKQLKEAEAVARRTNNQYALMVTALNSSNLSIDKGDLTAIKGFCESALTLARRLQDPSSELIALRGLAIYYFYQNKADQAELYAIQSLKIALELKTLKHVAAAYGVLSDIATLKRDFSKHNKLLIKSDSIRDLLINEAVAKNIQNIEAKYDTEKKEQQIRDLQQEAEIKDLSLQRNRLLNGVLFGTLISIVLIALLARRNYYQKKRLLRNENQIQEARIAQLESEKQMLAGEAVIKGQEEERGRLAKDLHDGLGGMLSGVKFSLANMKSNVVLDADNSLLFERSLDMLDHSIAELRRVAHNMMPEVLVRFGLSEAVKSYCESLRDSQVFKIDYQSLAMDERLADKKEIFIFRIVQELLNNITKHAQASHVLVQLARHGHEVSITVEDNGKGFDTSKENRGAGLSSVKSRVEYLKGKVDIQSSPGQGTSVHITVPV